jgi:hypothetical protein
MHLKYLHYFDNQSSESLLEAYGIVTKYQKLAMHLNSSNVLTAMNLTGRQQVLCQMQDNVDDDAYAETLDNQKEKEDKLAIMEQRFNSMQ